LQEKYLHDRIKVNGGKPGQLAGLVSVAKEGKKVSVTAKNAMSKRSLKVCWPLFQNFLNLHHRLSHRSELMPDRSCSRAIQSASSRAISFAFLYFPFAFSFPCMHAWSPFQLHWHELFFSLPGAFVLFSLHSYCLRDASTRITAAAW
jgi:hypothetical protein